jgi:hypothetical protein
MNRPYFSYYLLHIVTSTLLMSIHVHGVPTLSDDPYGNDALKPAAGGGVAFITIFGCIYIATLIFLYYNANLHNEKKQNTRKRSRSLLHAEIAVDLHDIEHHHDLGAEEDYLTFRQRRLSFTPRHISEAPSLPPAEDRIDFANVYSAKDSTILVDEEATTEEPASITPDSNAPVLLGSSHESLAVVTNPLHALSPPDQQMNVESLAPVTISIPQQSVANTAVADQFWLNYTGYNSFFSRHESFYHENVFLGLPKHNFNESLLNLVKLFDDDHEEFDGWISFSKMNLQNQRRAHQIIDVATSCSHEAMKKAEKKNHYTESPIGISVPPTLDFDHEAILASSDIDHSKAEAVIEERSWGLCLKRCNLDTEDAYSIIQVVTLNPFNNLALTQLDLSNNQLDDTFMVLLGEPSMLCDMLISQLT